MVTGRWTPERSQVASSLDERFRLGGPVREITVYFSLSDQQGLAIPVGQHVDGHFRILPDCSAFQAKILEWAENDLGNPASGNFQSSIEAFLYLYSRRDCVEKVGSIATLTLIVL